MIDSNHIKMNSSLIRNVTFQYHNLITDSFTQKFDIIFCRNVMIYFDMNAKKEVMTKFQNSLNPEGYFISGFFDSMLTSQERSHFDDSFASARIFRLKNYDKEGMINPQSQSCA